MADTLLEEKKKIAADFQIAFPNLTKWAPNRFYKVLGPLIIGIELIRGPFAPEYSPHFVAYPLWENSLNKCFQYPVLLKEFHNRKNLQFDIPYTNHDKYFEDVVYSIKKHSLIPFDDDVYLNKLFRVFDDYAKAPPLSASTDSFLQANLKKIKMLTGLYNSLDDAKLVYKDICDSSWNIKHFQAFGVDINNWIKDLEALINDRDGFLNQININKQDKKIIRLQSSELLPPPASLLSKITKLFN